jgi:hypothetical protein
VEPEKSAQQHSGLFVTGDNDSGCRWARVDHSL